MKSAFPFVFGLVAAIHLLGVPAAAQFDSASEVELEDVIEVQQVGRDLFAFEALGTSRNPLRLELDEERSGESQGLSDAERALLDREGDKVRFEIGYLFNLDGGTNIVRPSVAYIDNDLDGNIETGDGDKVYVYMGLRRGGSAYYALDVSSPTPLPSGVTAGNTPSLLWSIEQALRSSN